MAMMQMDDGFYSTRENDNEPVNAIIFGVDYNNACDFEHSMDEMKGLVEACDMVVAGTLTQTLDHPDNALYLGVGKVNELRSFVVSLEAKCCVCEGDLSPSQMRNLQDELKVPVWDRTNLILEIFSRRARTGEAKLQVEYAYLQFMLPRLAGMWAHLGRQGGGRFANKGEGEKQIELDRRMIKHRMAQLRKQLDSVSKTRQVQRDGRSRGGMPRVALVGYTNAGKSSLMNRILGETAGEKQVFEKDMLFATLDTSIRKIRCEGGREFLLSDTVGFIENLPHTLIKAFRSTLEEVKYADVLLVVLDSSDPNNPAHRKVTEDTLRELEADKIPRIYVMNKADKISEYPENSKVRQSGKVYISAKTGSGIDELLDMIIEEIDSGYEEISAVIPYSRGELTDRIRRVGSDVSEEYLAEGILVKAKCPKSLVQEIEKARINR